MISVIKEEDNLLINKPGNKLGFGNTMKDKFKDNKDRSINSKLDYKICRLNRVGKKLLN
jgi:hypothetical protein